MKKIILCILSLVMAFLVLVGCSNQEKETETVVSSAPQKEEVELVLEQTLWQLEGHSAFLLFHDGKCVCEYDLSAINGVSNEIEKSLSYEIEIDGNGDKMIFFPYLLGKQAFRLTYQSQTKTFVNTIENKVVLKQVSMRSFVEEFMKKINAAENDNEWQSQAEMNVAAGVRCNYWDTLYQAIDYYLKATLSVEEYAVFESETKAFETARQTAMDTAGKEVEGGSLYPVVTGGAYCTQTQKEIQNILTKYFS